jgi:hypothetical protein
MKTQEELHFQYSRHEVKERLDLQEDALYCSEYRSRGEKEKGWIKK